MLRNNFHSANGANGKYLHLCNRSAKCDCVLLGSYLVAIAYHNKEPRVKQFLESQFYVEAEIRLPYELFIQWAQLEIARKDYELAARLIRQYIQTSTRLETDASDSQGNNTLDSFSGGQSRPRQTYQMGNSGFGTT